MLGELGTADASSIGDDELPTSVPPIDIGGTILQLALLNDHACALLDDHAVRCWGLGVNGQLGYGDTDSIGDDEAPSVAGDVAVF
jgi:alpha-tubulin suppressor-like RCC1 family protein